MSVSLTLNQLALAVAEEMASNPAPYRVEVLDVGGATVLDCGVKTAGSLQAGARTFVVYNPGVAPEDVEGEFADAQYGDFKKAVAATVVEHLAPIRDRYQELQGDRARLEEVLQAGAERARSIASETLADVRERMGVGPPG